jgi:hypothetical protein
MLRINFSSWVLIYVGIAMLSSSLWFLFFDFFGLIPLALAILFSMGFTTNKYWINLVNNKPENVIWIKPITVKHTVGLVVTLYKEKKFELLTVDGKNLTINCNSEDIQKVFFEGIKKYFPHSHIGYNPEIQKLYFADRINFILILQKYNAYFPVNNITT